MKKLTSFLFCLTFFSINLFAQSEYEKGWEALNKTNVAEAIQHFERAKNVAKDKEKALLCLTWLYSHRNKNEKASSNFNKFFNASSDPYPELYAMWYENGVIGGQPKKKSYQLELLNKIENDSKNKGKLDGATYYKKYTHHLMSFDKKNSDKYFPKINNINDWEFLGPFDNVMNSGYGKDFGAVKYPKKDHDFKSRFGGKITWFDPELNTDDGYIFKGMFFRSYNSIVYAQTYLNSISEKDVILKFGYSGSLKIWLNDSMIYSNQEHRETEMDYFRFECTLNKGYNRVLVQLGDYEESLPNFTMRVSDLNDNDLNLTTSSAFKPYKKQVKKVKEIPYFAIEALKKKAENNDDILYDLLLAKAYVRALDLNNAEEILKRLASTDSLNYFVLRNLILMYDKADNKTNQNKYYEIFEDNYPEDRDILSNLIDEYYGEKDKEKTNETIEKYLKLYGTPYHEIKYNILSLTLDEKSREVLVEMDRFYETFPNDYQAFMTKYKIEMNYYSNPKKAKKLLEKFLDNNYDYDLMYELINYYYKEGQLDKAISILKKNIELVPYSIKSYRNISDLLTRQDKYYEAKKVLSDLLESRPSDYILLNELGVLEATVGNKDKAIDYFEQALDYFPFSFEINEKLRDLKDQTLAMKILPEFDPAEEIKKYEKNFVSKKKESYDIVSETRTKIIFKTRATGSIYSYIIKLNDESAIERFQNISFSNSRNMDLYFNELKTIKKNGQKIEAEREGGEVVFTNLEVGDYIFVSYREEQERGGKSSFFISDKFALSSYRPMYKREYNLLLEDGLVANFKFVNDSIPPKITKDEGFKKYTWTVKNPEPIKDEVYNIPFNDIANVLHVNLDYTWKDIVQWYGDLSTTQAQSDFTIKKLAKDLFEGKNLTQEEKSKIIYEFVCKNIQYSSVDFRQSGFIPQKASEIYHSRLGDCKDVSTLYVALAREAGLDANLVLINTRNNGKNDIVLPSLDFNHCIVKVNFANKSMFLELTDPDLPYGDLHNYHQDASILQIPTSNIPSNIGLTRLKMNDDNPSNIYRTSKVKIRNDYQLNVEKNILKTGINAAQMNSGYYYDDPETRKDNMKQAIANDFKSTVTLEKLEFDLLIPRRDSAKYSYAYVVKDDVIKLGSLNSLKIPFADELINMSFFEEEERKNEFNFINYEDTDEYHETLIISLDTKFTFKEIPKNKHFEYNGFVYDLKFKKIDSKTIEVKRFYKCIKENIMPKDFNAFKDFMDKVNEGENTHVLFQ